MITIDLQVNGLPVRQHLEPEVGLFALSTDDGANILDDDDQVVETYNGNSA